MSSLEEAIELLRHSRSAKRVSAAKQLRKLADRTAGPALRAALQTELGDPRTWEAKYHMILALGFSHDVDALPELWALTRMATEHTIIYSALGDAIVRLSEDSGVGGLSAVLATMETSNYPLIDGAFRAMALLRLVPSDDTITQILTLARHPEAAEQLGGTPKVKPGLRTWVAVAAAGWPKSPELVAFLHECEGFPMSNAALAACDSLAGKYGKWQPY